MLQDNIHVNHLSPDLVNPFGLITKRCNNKSQIWSIKVKYTIVTFMAIKTESVIK